YRALLLRVCASARGAPYPPTTVGAYCLVLFFFQAEDGIRASSVTGVQTCAFRSHPSAEVLDFGKAVVVPGFHDAHLHLGSAADRSEERRVGKEGRPRGGTCRCKRSTRESEKREHTRGTARRPEERQHMDAA